MSSEDTQRHLNTMNREALLNELMLDIIANTDCSWYAATAAVAFWEQHKLEGTASVYGLVEHDDEKPNIMFDKGKIKRSLKVGVYIGETKEEHWMITIQS